MAGSGDFVRPYAEGSENCYVNELVSPYRVPRDPSAKLTVAWNTGLILGGDGVVKSWGSGRLGGQAGEMPSDTLATIDGEYKSLITVSDTAWAVNSDGNIVTWGKNTEYEKAGGRRSGLPQFNYTPVVVSRNQHFEQVAAISDTLVALDSDGHIWQRQDANGQGTTRMVPDWSWVQLNANRTFTSIATSGISFWAIDSDGRLWATANYDYGTEFDEVSDSSNYVKLEPSSTGPMVTVDSDGSAVSWDAPDGGGRVMTVPDSSGQVLDYYTFMAANGDLYIKSVNFDWETQEVTESWGNFGVPPTAVRAPEEVGYSCAYPT